MMGKKSTEVKISTLIGKGCELHGDFNAKGSARIDGTVEGNVTVTGSLLVGAGGSINGNVSAVSAVIGGTVIGDVVAPEKLEMTATAKILGDIATKVIVIDENAVFQGKIDMNQTTPNRKGKAGTSKAVRTGKKTAKAAIAEALKEVEELENRGALDETEVPLVNAVSVEENEAM
ncbi:MAG: polymer-forming cytoskeletal protein [Lachnospiraceae bacterium]|nr:polymer-forming cytoskeletal protein [Lachnospiraceae bacterium]